MPTRPHERPALPFPSAAPYDIPTLDLARQALEPETPVYQWGQVGRRSRSVRTWLHYVDDYKFDCHWKDPGVIPHTRATSAGEPNFSLADDVPEAVAIWATYRKRWLARYWQHRGVGVLVDLDVPERYARLNMAGVPPGWRAFCTKAVSTDLERLERQAEAAQQWAGKERVTLLVYAGGRKARDLCADRGWLWTPDQRRAVEQQKAKEAIHGT